MKTVQLIRMAAFAALCTGITAADGVAWAQDPDRAETKKEHRAEMKQWHQQIESDLKKQDAELEKLQADLNAATGEKKVDALAATVNKLIDQRQEMHKKLWEMKAMKQRAKEGKRGATPGGAESPGAMQSPTP